MLDRGAVPARQAFLAELVFEEVATNIIRYAFADAGEHLFEVTITLNGEDVVMQFVDEGEPFDPLTQQPRAAAGTEREGGFGLVLVRKAAREARYLRQGGCNRLTLAVGRTWREDGV